MTIRDGFTSALTAARASWLGSWARYVCDVWQPLGSELQEYWTAYGGSSALIQSPMLWVSLIIDLFLYPLWDDHKWATAAVSILPNLLGLSIGAIAILLAFPTTQIFKFMTEEGRHDSFYIDLASRLTHFIAVQVIALIFGLLGTAYQFVGISIIGCWVLVYAILTAGVIALSLFGVAQIYNHPGAQEDQDQDKP